jgi:hypothetical protein
MANISQSDRLFEYAIELVTYMVTNESSEIPIDEQKQIVITKLINSVPTRSSADIIREVERLHPIFIEKELSSISFTGLPTAHRLLDGGDTFSLGSDFRQSAFSTYIDHF